MKTSGAASKFASPHLMPVRFQFNIGDIVPMLIAHRASSFLAARRNRYMTSSHTHETISA